MDTGPNFAAHRAHLLEHLPEDEAVLCFGAPTKRRNGDSDYRYRPDSDVYWLTGWDDPDVAVFLRRGEEPLTMFVQPKDPEREVWDGRRLGPDGARERFGADAAHPIKDLDAQLPKLLQGVRALHYAFARDADHDALVMSSVGKAAYAARKNGLYAPETFHHPSKLLHELRLHKSPGELALMRRAAALTAEGHRRAMAMGRPGVREYEIEAELVHLWRKAGSTGPGYEPIVAAGVNGTVLHYHTNRDVLREGETLLLDAGCEWSYYTADVTRTWPISGAFSSPQRDLYAAVLEAQAAAIDACRVGRRFTEIHDITVRSLTQSMVALGLLTGTVDDLIADESYKRYYMHGTSHWLGLDVHDVGSYGRDGHARDLRAGIVLTIEPGLYIDPKDERAPDALRGLAVRIEDDILVTDGDPEILTAAAPRTLAEVEAACQG